MFASKIFSNLSWFSKVCKTRSDAIKGMKDGDFLMIGGFGLCGTPMNLIQAIR